MDRENDHGEEVKGEEETREKEEGRSGQKEKNTESRQESYEEGREEDGEESGEEGGSKAQSAGPYDSCGGARTASVLAASVRLGNGWQRR